jgi:hypothetical protein
VLVPPACLWTTSAQLLLHLVQITSAGMVHLLLLRQRQQQLVLVLLLASRHPPHLRFHRWIILHQEHQAAARVCLAAGLARVSQQALG